MRPYTPPLIHQAATAEAASGWRVAVSSDTREPPEPPAITAGVMARCDRGAARGAAGRAARARGRRHVRRERGPGARVGGRARLGRAGEAHVGGAGVGPVPD